MTSLKPDLAHWHDLVAAGTVPSNRRDFLRISALATGAAALSFQGVHAAVGQPVQRLQDASPGGFTLSLPFNAYGQEVNLDPHQAVNWGPFWVLLPYAWSGLLRFDEHGAVQADLAESVEPNEDGTIWTAVLREGIAFADGTATTAEHVVQSWTRALDSARLSPMYRFMEPIIGASEIAQGNNVPLGIDVIDDRTVAIHLTTPLAHFPSYLATFGYAVVHPDIDNQGDEALEPGAACSGAWSIVEQTESVIRMVQNTHYWGEPSTDVTELNWLIAPGGATDATILEWYQGDQIAVADVPASLLPTIAEDEVLTSQMVHPDAQSSTLVLAMDFHQPPFDDVRVRRAVAAAIDREVWSTEIQEDTYIPAHSFTPPVLANIANYTAPEDAYDDDVAALMEASGFDVAGSEHEVIFFQPVTSSDDDIVRTEKLLDMIREQTGLQINHDTNLTPEQITAARQDAGGLQMVMQQWQLDSDQPSLLATMSQQSGYNAGWVNWTADLEDAGGVTPGADATTFDELVSSAQTTMDETERNQKYAEAEALLLKNAVLVPVGFWNPAWLQKPWLVGTRQGAWSGSTPVRIDADVTIDVELLPATPET